MISIPNPDFPLGQVVATPGAKAALDDAKQTPWEFLSRHARCDWGDVCERDAEANNEALREGGRLFSVYKTNQGESIWIITEASRDSTCILLPEEY